MSGCHQIFGLHSFHTYSQSPTPLLAWGLPFVLTMVQVAGLTWVDWTIRELAMYDLPALVEHVCNETGYDKVSVV